MTTCYPSIFIRFRISYFAITISLTSYTCYNRPPSYVGKRLKYGIGISVFKVIPKFGGTVCVVAKLSTPRDFKDRRSTLLHPTRLGRAPGVHTLGPGYRSGAPGLAEAERVVP